MESNNAQQMDSVLMRSPGQLLSPGLESLRFGKNLLTITGLVSAYAGQASLGSLRIRDHKSRLDFFIKNVSLYSGRALKQFNFSIEVFGLNPGLMEEKRFLLVGNHLSYLDIMILSSVQPCVFVTSVDMQETPFLGQMAEMGGSLFVERRNRRHIGRDIGMLADTIRNGYHVVVYPEGTSGDGSGVMKFKPSLLTSAIDAGVDIMPVVLKYTEIDGQPFSIANRDKVCWYGDMGFAPHFFGLMSLKHAKVELHFGDPIAVTPGSTRHELAEKCHTVIDKIYGHPL
jgi:1-acyl-sn-glycerol-3-phosphate acyltransferase